MDVTTTKKSFLKKLLAIVLSFGPGIFAIGYTIGSAEHDIISQRMKDCPLFIWPVFKENDEDHFVLLSQMQDKFVLCTFLEEYKRSPDTASPWITVAVYDDFCKEKNMALVRGDFTPNLTKAEGDTTSRMILHGYHDDEAFKHIHNFNKQPDQFDYNNFLTFFKSVHKDLKEDAEARKTQELAEDIQPNV